jgi:molecular chaperone DnaK
MKTTSQDPVVGIDLGTTNSAIAVVLDDGLTMIPVLGQPTMPSAVGLDPAGRLIVGQPAKNQSISSPENTVLSVKRLMGTDETVELGGKTYRPEEISSLILGELKRAAESHLGHPVGRAVITVPAFFNERQRQATQDAGRLAGFDVLRIINEPTAAALAYGAGTTGDHANETLLVYDLGGGTFDVSLVTVENGVVEVRASHGDTRLGGDDFDEALAKLAEDRFEEKDRGASGGITPLARRRLKAVMERAKISLSDQPFAAVHEEFLTATAHLTTEVPRSEYEALIEPWIEKSLACLQRALADAAVTPAQVDKIMLVGGATRTPLVQEILENRLGKTPRHEINPDLIVTMGAAIQGAALAGRPAPAILIDITAHSYGIGAMAHGPGMFMPVVVCSHIIRRGTPLPVKKAQVFTTGRDSQTEVEIEVFQGESHIPEENLKIGEFWVKGLAKAPAGNEVVVEFGIDLNGLLNVTATEKQTGLAKSVTIDTAGHHRINLDVARTNLAALFEEDDALAELGGGDDEDIEISPDTAPAPAGQEAPSGLLASAKSLRRRAESLLERGVSDSDTAEIRRLLDTSSAAITGRDWPALQEADDKLSDVLFYLED